MPGSMPGAFGGCGAGTDGAGKAMRKASASAVNVEPFFCFMMKSSWLFNFALRLYRILDRFGRKFHETSFRCVWEYGIKERQEVIQGAVTLGREG